MHAAVLVSQPKGDVLLWVVLPWAMVPLQVAAQLALSSALSSAWKGMLPYLSCSPDSTRRYVYIEQADHSLHTALKHESSPAGWSFATSGPEWH